MPFVPMAGGSGRSTPPQLEPPLLEKYPRIGSRKISLEPAASILGARVFRVIKVSLCGPHSFDRSTLLPELREAVGPAWPSGPFLARYVYLSHQVGLWELFSAQAVMAKATIRNLESAYNRIIFMLADAYKLRVSLKFLSRSKDY